MAKRYTLNNGKVSFGTLEAKEAYILQGVLMDIQYTLKYQKPIDNTVKALLKLSERKIKALIKSKLKLSQK